MGVEKSRSQLVEEAVRSVNHSFEKVDSKGEEEVENWKVRSQEDFFFVLTFLRSRDI